MMKRAVRSPRNAMVSILRRINDKTEAQDKTKPKKHQEKIYYKYPNNCYVDINRKRCYEAMEPTGDEVVLKEYSSCAPFIRRPVPSDLISSYKVKNGSYKYTKLPLEEVKHLRRARKIDFASLPWMEDNAYCVFLAMLHCGRERYP